MKKLLSLLLLSLVLVLAACGSDTPKEEQDIEETKTDIPVVEEEPEAEEVSVKMEMMSSVIDLIEEGLAFDIGTYAKGDIPKGEYAFISFKGDSEYYVEEDSSGSIIDNENFDSFGYVQVHEAGDIETRGVLINDEGLEKLQVSGAKELYEIMNEKENYLDSGWYKVGRDIEPGEYVISSYGSGYAAIMTGPVGSGDIVENENFNGDYTVILQEGQYLNISKATINE